MSLERIARDAAAASGFTVAEIRGMSRRAKLVRVRHDCFLRASEELGHSSGHIGRFFGGRDHTTVLHGIARARERRAAAARRPREDA